MENIVDLLNKMEFLSASLEDSTDGADVLKVMYDGEHYYIHINKINERMFFFKFINPVSMSFPSENVLSDINIFNVKKPIIKCAISTVDSIYKDKTDFIFSYDSLLLKEEVENFEFLSEKFKVILDLLSVSPMVFLKTKVELSNQNG